MYKDVVDRFLFFLSKRYQYSIFAGFFKGFARFFKKSKYCRNRIILKKIEEYAVFKAIFDDEKQFSKKRKWSINSSTLQLKKFLTSKKGEQG